MVGFGPSGVKGMAIPSDSIRFDPISDPFGYGFRIFFRISGRIRIWILEKKTDIGSEADMEISDPNIRLDIQSDIQSDIRLDIRLDISLFF